MCKLFYFRESTLSNLLVRIQAQLLLKQKAKHSNGLTKEEVHFFLTHIITVLAPGAQSWYGGSMYGDGGSFFCVAQSSSTHGFHLIFWGGSSKSHHNIHILASGRGGEEVQSTPISFQSATRKLHTIRPSHPSESHGCYKEVLGNLCQVLFFPW